MVGLAASNVRLPPGSHRDHPRLYGSIPGLGHFYHELGLSATINVNYASGYIRQCSEDILFVFCFWFFSEVPNLISTFPIIASYDDTSVIRADQIILSRALPRLDPVP